MTKKVHWIIKKAHPKHTPMFSIFMEVAEVSPSFFKNIRKLASIQASLHNDSLHNDRQQWKSNNISTKIREI